MNRANTGTYRVDRMDKVEIIEDPVSEKVVSLRGRVGEFTEQAFKMYGGELVEVQLEFDRQVIGPVYDKFGEDTKMYASGDNKFLATVYVQISPTFWGWLFQFGNKMRVCSPLSISEKYDAMLKDSCNF